MALRLADLAQHLNAQLQGDPALTVSHPATLDDANEGALTFLANPRYTARLAETRATAALVREDFAGPAPCALLRVADPDRAFAVATRLLVPPPPRPPSGVHPRACVADDAVLGEDVSVGPFAVIEPGAHIGARTVIYAHAYVGHDATVGADCVLHPRATLYRGVRLGDRVVLHAGAVVGADGFGYLWNGRELELSPQVGTVTLGDGVELGANATVDRARFGATVIGAGTKLDNLVHIAHNVHIGRHCAFAAQVGLAGSATVGDGVQMGGQVGVGGHIHVGDRATVAAQSGVSKDVPAGGVVFGYPAQARKAWVAEHMHISSLPKMRKLLKVLAAGAGLKDDGTPADDGNGGKNSG